MSQNQLFTILDAVECTNNYAMAKLHAGLAVNGEAWFARDQWGGKGQRHNKWLTQKDENLIMTIILKPDKVFRNKMFFFNTIVACTCHQFFSILSGEGTFIKWPNDIYFNDRKAGGILIENVFSGHSWEWAVVGIGININQTDFGSVGAKSTSLKIICKQIFDPIELAKQLHLKLLQNFEKAAESSQGFYLNYYNEYLYKKGVSVKLKKENIVFQTTVKGVNINGQLITSDAIERQFNSGEIKWLFTE